MFKFLPLISIKDITGAIFDAVVTPVTNAVGKVISTVLNTIINDVLMPILGPFFKSLVEPILGIIGDLFMAWIHIKSYYLYVAVLKVIDVLEYAFNIFGGVSDVTVVKNGQKSTDFLLNVFFTNSGISKIFWSITLLAFAVSLVFGIIAVMKSTTDLDGKRPVGKVIGAIAKTGLTFLIVPFFTLFALNMTNIVIKKTNEILSMSVGMDTPSLGTVLFLATTLQAEENSAGEMSATEMAEALKNGNDNDTMAGFTDGVRADYYSGKKNYWNAGDVLSDFNITQVKTVLGLFMSLFVALMLIICTFVFITRIFEVMLLYIASPFFVATIPLDDGAKFNEWRNMFIAKLFSGFGMLIGMKLYIILVPIIMSSNLELSSINFVNMGLKVLFIVGGAFAIYKSNSLLMQILNIQASYAEASTAQAGFGFIMSAKNMGMRALRGSGMTSYKKPQGDMTKEIANGSNKNPNLNTFNRVSVSAGTTRNKNITIGAHRANKNNIEIGGHRRTWENGTISGGVRKTDFVIGNNRSSQSSSSQSTSTWQRGTINRTTQNSSFSGGTSTTVNQTTSTSVNNSFSSSSSISNNVSTPSSSSSTKSTPKNTWKKATPTGKNDNGNKF